MTTDRAVEKLEYQPALDGLRGVAIALVLVYHHGLLSIRPSLYGGFLGVDVFFVLSGYLITSLLLVEHASTGRVALGSFWIRRARRLLPALLIMFLGVALYSATIAAPSELAQIRGDAIATLLYVQNWHLIATNLKHGTLLNNTWSLSVEEQWYLVWPAFFALLLALKRVRPSRVLAIIVGLAAASALWTYLLYRNGPHFLHEYYGTDTRAQELLVGAALAVVLRYRKAASDRSRLGLEVAGIVGCLVVTAIVIMAKVGNGFLSCGGTALFAVAVAAVIAAATQGAGTIVRRVLSFKPLCALGLISYGLYLFHGPLYFWLTPARTHTSGWLLFALRLAVALIAATASYLFVERPIRRGALHGVALRVGAPLAVATVVAATLLATRVPPPPPPLLLSDYTIATLQHAATGPGRRVLVVGHDVAFELQWVGGPYKGDGVNAVAAGFVDCSFITGGVNVPGVGIRPEAEHCKKLLPTLRRLRHALRPSTIVLVPDSLELYDRKVGSQLLQVGTPAWAAHATAQLDTTLAALKPSDRTPVILTTIPCAGTATKGNALDEARTTRQRAVNQFLATYAYTHRRTVTLADLDGLLCHNGAPIQSIGGRQIVGAKGALTRDGAQEVWSWVAREIPTRN